MKYIKRKTEVEIKKEYEAGLIQRAVKDTSYHYLVCDTCQVAFLGDDLIRFSNGSMFCPLTRGFFFKRPCLASLVGGDESSFDRYYKERSSHKLHFARN